VLGRKCRVYAIDLLGYGYSDKPDPLSKPRNSVYNFENWSRQLAAFATEARSVLLALVPIRPRRRGERDSLRTFSPVASLRPPPLVSIPARATSTPFDSND
jgi:hypothetical protein